VQGTKTLTEKGLSKSVRLSPATSDGKKFLPSQQRFVCKRKKEPNFFAKGDHLRWVTSPGRKGHPQGGGGAGAKRRPGRSRDGGTHASDRSRTKIRAGRKTFKKGVKPWEFDLKGTSNVSLTISGEESGKGRAKSDNHQGGGTTGSVSRGMWTGRQKKRNGPMNKRSCSGFREAAGFHIEL